MAPCFEMYPDVGVETGQVLFAVAVSLLLTGLQRFQAGGSRVLMRTAPYSIGGIAAFWTLQRVSTFLT